MKSKNSRRFLTSIAAAGLATLVPSIAFAEDPYAPVTPYGRDGMVTDIGVGLSVGGGLTNFTNSSIMNMTDPGGSWTARLTLGTRTALALEAAYIGTANDIRSPGLDSNATLLGQGVETLLRINVIPNLPVQPYIFGGVAWKRYQLVGDSFNTSDVREQDDVLEVPVGLGLAFHVDNLVLDGRFDYHPTFNEDLLPGMDRRDAIDGLENWNLSARAGFEF